MTSTANSHIDDKFSRGVAYQLLIGGIGRLAWLGAVSALGVGCNQFIGLEEVSLAGDAGADSAVIVDAAVDGPVDGAVDAAAPTNLFVFLTAATFDGDFGVPDGARTTADIKCDDFYQATLTDKGCTEVHAFIQIDDNVDTLARMDINFPIPQGIEVLRVIDDTPVAANWDVLVDPNLALLAPISDSATSVFFWSGRGAGTNLQCSNWTSASAGEMGNAGDATKTNGWTARANINCDDFQPLLCVCW